MLFILIIMEENQDVSEVLIKAQRLKQASFKAATLSAPIRENILLGIAVALMKIGIRLRKLINKIWNGVMKKVCLLPCLID